MNGASLRAELIGTSGERPGFAILLPAGWRLDAWDAERFNEEALDAVRDLPAELRLALEPSMRQMVEQARTAPASSQVELAGVIRQVEATPEQFVPMSLTLHWFTPPTGATIQDFGLRMMDTRDARPLDGARGVLRWMETSRLSDAQAEGDFGGPVYLVPVAGQRRLSLLVRTVLPMPQQPDAAMESMHDGLFLLSDSIIATLRWKRDAA